MRFYSAVKKRTALEKAALTLTSLDRPKEQIVRFYSSVKTHGPKENTLNPNPVNCPKDQIVQDMAQIGDPPGGTKSIGVQGR